MVTRMAKSPRLRPADSPGMLLIARARSETEPRLSEVFLSSYDVQSASSLFRLPAELRNMIFLFTMRGYKEYNVIGKYQGDDINDTSLLLTCKKAYIDGCRMAVSMQEHTIWDDWSDLGWTMAYGLDLLPTNFFWKMSYWQLLDVVKLRTISTSLSVGFGSFPHKFDRELASLSNLRSLTIELRDSRIATRYDGTGNSWTTADRDYNYFIDFIDRFANLEVLTIEYEVLNTTGNKPKTDDRFGQYMRGLLLEHLRYQRRPVEEEYKHFTQIRTCPANWYYPTRGHLRPPLIIHEYWTHLKFVRKVLKVEGATPSKVSD